MIGAWSGRCWWGPASSSWCSPCWSGCSGPSSGRSSTCPTPARCRPRPRSCPAPATSSSPPPTGSTSAAGSSRRTTAPPPSSWRAATRGHRGHRAPLAEALHEAGLSVLLFDYRGYGGNPGSPSEEGLALDVRAARDFLIGDAGVPPERLLYLGESLGAAVVTELATEHPPAGLVLRSPFVDLAAVAAVHYPFLPARALLRDRFPVAEQLARVDVPDDRRLRQRRLDRAARAEPRRAGGGRAAAPAGRGRRRRPQRPVAARRRAARRRRRRAGGSATT